MDVRRKFKGFNLAFEDIYLVGAYHPFFFKLADEKRSGVKNSSFSNTNRFGLPEVLFCVFDGSTEAGLISVMLLLSLCCVYLVLYILFPHSRKLFVYWELNFTPYNSSTSNQGEKDMVLSF